MDKKQDKEIEKQEQELKEIVNEFIAYLHTLSKRIDEITSKRVIR